MSTKKKRIIRPRRRPRERNEPGFKEHSTWEEKEKLRKYMRRLGALLPDIIR